MKQISIAVHPISRRILQSEYGHGPISIGQRDFLFNMLSYTRLRDRVELTRVNEVLTDLIDLQVNDELARHLQTTWYLVGMNLFSWHKDQMCRYASAIVRQPKGDASNAIYDWLTMYEIDEDEYSLETAYKCWLRWNRKIKDNNAVFSARMRGKAAANLRKKIGIKKDLTWTVPDVDVEIEAAHILDLAEGCLRKVPKSLKQHLRLYLYRIMQGLSEREVAKKLNVPHRTAGYAYCTIRAWMDTDLVMRNLMGKVAPYQST